MLTLSNAIIEVFAYYNSFQYPLSEKELRKFLPLSASPLTISEVLNNLLLSNKIVKKGSKYCLIGNGSVFAEHQRRVEITEAKLQNAKKFINRITRLSWICGVAVTGSCAMQSAIERDDVDLFVITAPRRIFLTRLILLLLAQLMRVRRKRNSGSYADTICLNLFFDRSDLHIPSVKQNKHAARELVQMSIIYEKGNVFGELQDKNTWIYEYFPNTQANSTSIQNVFPGQRNQIIDWLEALCKRAQMYLISRHKTNEYITDTQLWFHPVSMIE